MNSAGILAVVQALSLAHELYLKFQRGALTPEQLMIEWSELQVTFPQAIEGWLDAGRVAKEQGFE